MKKLENSLQHFLAYIPKAPTQWVVVYQESFHSDIVSRLEGSLPGASFFDLQQETATVIYDIGKLHRRNEGVGFLEFVMRYPASLYQNGHSPGVEGLYAFNSWPQNRARLCFDVNDRNFDVLFSETPDELAARCYKLRAELKEAVRVLHYDSGSDQRLTMTCTEADWVAYTGLERFSDYILPSGEVSCHPSSIDGRLSFEGWIIGTMPFGVKYGHIGKGELELEIKDGKVSGVTGANRQLCSDVEGAIATVPPLRTISEVGIGQSLAVGKAAAEHSLGYFWHERNFGLHLGLGAELPTEGSTKPRTGGHHLDLVLSTGRLSGDDGQPIMAW